MKSPGFSLIELMTALAIIAILLALAIPSYQSYVLKANRQTAIATLLKIALAEEHYYNEQQHYTDSLTDLADPAAYDALYQYTVAVDNNSVYTVRADAQGVQRQDTECCHLSLNQQGVKTPERCWQ